MTSSSLWIIRFTKTFHKVCLRISSMRVVT
nr:MAG TPA: hypothetical protein [Caudoviricetes sp.]